MKQIELENKIFPLLSESEAASFGRRLAAIDQQINSSKLRRRLILEDTEDELTELRMEIDQILQRAEDKLRAERNLVRELTKERKELITALLTNVIRIPAPEHGKVVQAVVYDLTGQKREEHTKFSTPAP